MNEPNKKIDYNVIAVWVNAIVVYGWNDEHFYKYKRFFNGKIDVRLIIIYC